MVIQESTLARVEAERNLLGAILIEGTYLDGDCISTVAKLVNPSDFSDATFHDGLHSRIFTAMLRCKHPHQIAVADELYKTDKLKKNDISYLSHLIVECISPLDYQEFARVVASFSHPGKKKPKQGVDLA